MRTQIARSIAGATPRTFEKSQAEACSSATARWRRCGAAWALGLSGVGSVVACAGDGLGTVRPDRAGAARVIGLNAAPGARLESRVGLELQSAAPAPSAQGSDALVSAVEGAAAGVENPRFAEFLRRHWAESLARAPMWATRLGVHDFDDRLASTGPDAREHARRHRAELREALATIDLAELSASDQLSYRAFVAELDDADAAEPCRFDAWNISARGNAVSSAFSLARRHRVETPLDARNLVARYGQLAGHIDQSIADLRAGLAQGWVASRESLRRTIESVARQLQVPVENSALLEPALAEHPEFSPAEIEAFHHDLERRIRWEIYPAMQRFHDLLVAELEPAGREGGSVGLSALPAGETCYAAMVRRYTTLDKDPSALHALGKAEIARINREMRELGQRLFGTRKLSVVLERLRNDPKLYFSSAEEVRAFAEKALREAESKSLAAFHRLPSAACEVVPIPSEEAPYTTIAYYSGPSPDGAKPGQYFVNTSAPETRPRYEAKVLAYHEAVPGHHLQIAWAQELPAVPAFRRFGGQTAFVEGWALYSERLAGELGLYADDLDAMGVASFDAWRAARLVVDTGIHAMGWSRAQAVEYLTRHTALALNNIDTEVDRYIAWPGQALAYKVGQLEILRLRAQAERELGQQFVLADFHEMLLGAGALSLPNLRRRIERYIEDHESRVGGALESSH